MAAPLGYDLHETGSGERILAAGITEHFVKNVRGELEPGTAGLTKPVAETRMHARHRQGPVVCFRDALTNVCCRGAKRKTCAHTEVFRV